MATELSLKDAGVFLLLFKTPYRLFDDLSDFLGHLLFLSECRYLFRQH